MKPSPHLRYIIGTSLALLAFIATSIAMETTLEPLFYLVPWFVLIPIQIEPLFLLYWILQSLPVLGILTFLYWKALLRSLHHKHPTHYYLLLFHGLGAYILALRFPPFDRSPLLPSLQYASFCAFILALRYTLLSTPLPPIPPFLLRKIHIHTILLILLILLLFALGMP